MRSVPKTTGERIRQLREARGLSRNNLARKAQISQGNLSDIENGRVPNPRRDTLAKLAVVLRTSVGYLACDTDDPSPPSMDRSDFYSADMPLPPIGWDELTEEEREHVRDVTRHFEEAIIADILRRKRGDG